MAEGTERPRAAVKVEPSEKRLRLLPEWFLDGEHGCVGWKPESTAAYLAREAVVIGLEGEARREALRTAPPVLDIH